MATWSYKCAHCGGTFETTSELDDQAHAEARGNWGRDGRAPDMAVICDDCYRRFMAWADEMGIVGEAER
jgi:hypothetical protein